jgi:hypothetical protein
LVSVAVPETPQVLDGTLDRELALRRIVDELAPTPTAAPRR